MERPQMEYHVELMRKRNPTPTGEERKWDDKAITDFLNAFGKDGWGLVFWQTTPELRELTCIFIRARSVPQR